MRFIVLFIFWSTIFMQAQNSKKDFIEIPKKAYAFEYREPYFTKNFDKQFRLQNKTHTLEETWGLWGHNINKFITTNELMFSEINGEINPNQFCFSSPQLEFFLAKAIKRKVKESPATTKFMVMPNDNHLVCQCYRCKYAGNTTKNASPAVFKLLNKLAKNFPKLQFFTTAYISTKNPPKFPVQSNIGVMISTIDFPKGIVIQKSTKLATVTRTIKNWKSIINKIYLWDYAINFDNYFEFYPTVFITQQNLQYYKKQGVTGVFMQGNENSYTSFGNLKCYLYAQLLQNPNIDLKVYIKHYFDTQYPTINDLLYNYYIKIEETALASNYPLDIYGGIQQSYKKYLNILTFQQFYFDLQHKLNEASISEQQNIKSLILALSFQWLEMVRTSKNVTNNAIKEECLTMVKYVSRLQKSTNLDTYNEIGNTLNTYYSLWNNEILTKKTKNLFHNKEFKLLSKLDADYPNSKMLNDGLVGFYDYYNNWLLATRDTIKLELEASEVANSKYIEISFLDDPRHRIYLPEYVLVSIDNKTIKTKIYRNGSKKNSIKIWINLKPKDKKIRIEVFKQEKFRNNSIACDEIVFK